MNESLPSSIQGKPSNKMGHLRFLWHSCFSLENINLNLRIYWPCCIECQNDKVAKMQKPSIFILNVAIYKSSKIVGLILQVIIVVIANH